MRISQISQLLDTGALLLEMIAVPCGLHVAHHLSTSHGTDKAEREQPGLERLITVTSDDGRDI